MDEICVYYIYIKLLWSRETCSCILQKSPASLLWTLVGASGAGKMQTSGLIFQLNEKHVLTHFLNGFFFVFLLTLWRSHWLLSAEQVS